jgi:magnesium-transporting ATPase (P-type)
VNELTAAFRSRVQELTVIGSLISNTIVVTDDEQAKYALELRQFQRCAVEAVAKQLETDIERGLTGTEAVKRRAIYGANVLKPPHVQPLWLKLILALFGGFAPVRISVRAF